MAKFDETIVDYSGKTLSDDDIKQRVEELRQLILGDNTFKNFRKDDSYLCRFLHCTDFDVPAAFKRIQDYYKLLQEHPDWFASGFPSELKQRISECGRVMLRDRDKSGRCIFLVKAGVLDTSKTNPGEQAQIDELWFESILEEPETQAKGISVILDMRGYSWQMFKWLTPSNIKISTRKIEVYPLKEMIHHVVNTSFLVSASIKLVWPFLSQKLKERVKFHFDNWPSLHEYISPDILPPEYGGTACNLDFDKLNEVLFQQSMEISARLKHQFVATVKSSEG